MMMHPFGNYGMWGPSFGMLGVIGAVVGLLFLVITIVLKGYALWHAAKRSEKGWFIALLILNTAGILELVYLIFIVKLWPKVYSGPKAHSSSANENSNGPKAN